MRALDLAATRELAIPSILLMEHASLALARHAQEMLPTDADAGVLVVCGHGNNAGDGFALARHLAVRDVPVALLLSHDGPLKGDTSLNLDAARALAIPALHVSSIPLPEAFRRAAALLGGRIGLVVDAVLGTGLTGAPRGPALELIRAINDHGRRAGKAEDGVAPVLAVDIPSGLDADTGEPAGGAEDAVRADRTVTFVGLKRGFLSLSAQPYLGEVHVEQIGTPRSLSERLGERLPSAERPGDAPARPEEVDEAVLIQPPRRPGKNREGPRRRG